eukprot:15335929-Ditylum_brightwellii.AAC.1
MHPVAKETCIWQEVCKWHDMCAAAKEDCTVMRVCEKQAFVEKDNMNKIEMKMPRGQPKETEPHELCDPEKPHKSCEPAKHQKVCARRTRVSEGDKNEQLKEPSADCEMKDPEPHKLCEPENHQEKCMPEPHELCEPEQHPKVWQENDSEPKEL